MSNQFTLLARHVEAALQLSAAERDSHLATLPCDVAAQVRELLQFEHATLDLSQVAGLELALDVAAQPPPQHIGRWHVLELVGRGGMASVYRVERSEGAIRQIAACKVGYARTDLEDGLRRETAALLELGHPGIAGVLDFGHTDGGRPYMVSELVDGADIVSFANQQRLSLMDRLELFEHVLSAVAHTHERLLLHQDIKPDNILVTADGRPRLIDFGLAMMLGGAGDSPVLGYTPRYASPEQKRGGNLTVRSDIYSLGITLSMLLQGATCARRHGDVRAVIDKASREDPAGRYSSATAMAADLRAIRELRPIAAHAGRPGYRLKRFVQRHPLPLVLGALIVLSIGIGMAATLRQTQRAMASARTADAALVNAQAVKDFLIEDVLGRANPADPGYDPKNGIVGVLDNAAAAIERRFDRNPLAAAGIHAALAMAQRNLGRFEQAVSHAKRSADLYASELGVGHEFSLTSHYVEALALSAINVTEAQQVLDATDALAGERLNEHSRLALAAAQARAQIAQNRLLGPEALAAYQYVEQLQSRLLPDDASRAAWARSGIAEAYMRMNQPEQAIRALEAPAPELPSLVHQASRHRLLAMAHTRLGEPERALHHAQQAVALLRESLGDDAYSTLAAWGTLSNSYMLRGECDGALDAGRTAFEGMRRVYGEKVQSALIERGNLGDKQSRCGHHIEGLGNMMAASRGLRELHGADNAAFQAFNAGAAELLIQLERHDEALDRFDEMNEETLREDDVRALLDTLGPKLESAESRRRLEVLQARVAVAPDVIAQPD